MLDFCQCTLKHRRVPIVVNDARAGKRLANLEALGALSEPDPFEGPMVSLPQVEARLRVVGVKKVEVGSDLRVANATLRAVEETARLTGRVPDQVIIAAERFKELQDDAAHHIYYPYLRVHVLEINPNAKIFSVPGSFPTHYTRFLQESKWFSTGNALHVLRHEMGHVMHAENSLTLFLKWQNQDFPAQMLEDLQNSWPSEYAAENPYEFVAEVYSMKLEGKKVSPVVEKWYKDLGGWEL